MALQKYSRTPSHWLFDVEASYHVNTATTAIASRSRCLMSERKVLETVTAATHLHSRRRAARTQPVCATCCRTAANNCRCKLSAKPATDERGAGKTDGDARRRGADGYPHASNGWHRAGAALNKLPRPILRRGRTQCAEVAGGDHLRPPPTTAMRSGPSSCTAIDYLLKPIAWAIVRGA